MASRNETEEDLQNEREVAEVLAQAWGLRLEKLTEDKLYLADYAAMRGSELTAFIEVRCRTCSSGEYPSVFIPLHKLQWARSIWDTFGIPYFYVVKFAGDGVIAYTAVNGIAAPVRWAARRTERDTHPDGPVAEISAANLRILARQREIEF